MNLIDSIDERILAELQANGRLTMKALAERVGLSSPAMIERVRRLEDRGVIAGYRAIVAPGALGRSVTALILARIDVQSHEAFHGVVAGNTAIVECHRMTGAHTHLVKAHVDDMAALELLVDALAASGAACETSVVLSSPLSWREIVPPDDGDQPGGRLPRRRRRGPGAPEEEPAAAEAGAVKRRGPGRPRGRRSSPP